ncbi:hypothetical protein ABZ949_01960 [Micromonospora tulbaghiae]|uniref:hypothetical protein n=1 Tax=Micromonospora tulbaghiae TaxID=479978 RepID=UPI0033ED87E1
MTRLAEIEAAITRRTNNTATLRREGARILADIGASGSDVLAWLTNWGVSVTDARNLCADIIRERRTTINATADRDTLKLIVAGRILLRSPADGYGLTGPEPVSYPAARRVADLKERGLAAPAYQVRGESYPVDGWPQPYVLTDAGREVLAAFQTRWTEQHQ